MTAEDAERDADSNDPAALKEEVDPDPATLKVLPTTAEDPTLRFDPNAALEPADNVPIDEASPTETAKETSTDLPTLVDPDVCREPEIKRFRPKDRRDEPLSADPKVASPNADSPPWILAEPKVLRTEARAQLTDSLAESCFA